MYKKKYKQGARIKDMQSLIYHMKRDTVIWIFGGPRPIAFVRSQQFWVLDNALLTGNICVAERVQEV